MTRAVIISLVSRVKKHTQSRQVDLFKVTLLGAKKLRVEFGFSVFHPESLLPLVVIIGPSLM